MTRKPKITNDMTAQDMFNAAYWGVVEQGVQSYAIDTGCVYQGFNDAKPVKCAIGHCMTGEESAKAMETDLGGILYDDMEYFPQRVQDHFDLCEQMQNKHDEPAASGIDFITRYKVDMARIANRFGLDAPQD